MKVTMCCMLAVLSLSVAPLRAQPLPQYELTVQNPVLTGTTYRFDICVRRTGLTDWRLGNSQFIMTFNTAAFASPAIGRVSASEQIGSGFFFDQVISGNEIRITIGGNGSFAGALDISAATPGTRISTYEIGGVAAAEPSAGLTWVNAPSLVRTGVSEIDAADNYREITDAASHVNGGGEFARLSGYKFNDLNGDGAWDQPVEPALDGWIVELTRDSATASAATGDGAWPDGYYEFVNLTPSSYGLAEVSQTGWSATAVPTSPVLLSAGENSQNNNFGNFNGPTLRGMKFLDADGDSVKDAGEPGLAGWQIVATKVGGGGLKTQTTNINGEYVFAFLPSDVGVWQISETPQAGWIQTVPASPPVYTDTILSGSAITGIDFGNFLGAVIGGSKFNDFDRDSVKAPTEGQIAAWLIRLKRGGVQVDSQYTDGAGNFLFDSLPAGSYEVSEEARPGWSQTVPPAPGTYPVAVSSSGFTSSGNIFGNFHISPTGGEGDISGKKFEDMNGNGVRDSGDVPAAGWKIYLAIGPITIDSASTDSAGSYAFSLLEDGMYTVSEEARAGWIRSLPADPGTYELTIGEIQRIYVGLDFGNYRLGSMAGVAYRDVNHNGAKNLTDPGLAGLFIDITGPDGPFQIQSQAAGAWSLASLRPGQYTLSQQVPSGYYLTEPVAGSYAITLVSNDQRAGLNFGNSVVRDTFDFRSFSYDSLALARDERGKLGKPVRRKADKVEFCKTYVNTTATEVDGMDLIFHSPLYVGYPDFPLIVEPAPANVVVRSNGHKVELAFIPAIQPGGTVELCGWAKGGRRQQHSHATWLSHGEPVSRINLNLSPEFYLNQLRLPMPNPLNAMQESFLAGGFGPQGLVIGVARPDAPRMFGWVRLRRLGDAQRSLHQRGILHTTVGRGLDFFNNGQPCVREQRRILPNRLNSRLFADLLALRVNIVASELGVTPVGFGQLTYDDEISPLSGLMIDQIASYADSAMTYWGGRTPDEYLRLDSVIRRINAAFEGPIDTVSFATSLVYIGHGKLRDIPYLRANPGVEPRMLERAAYGEPEVPNDYALFQNYPNPFNPTTTIGFELPEAGTVRLSVYDLLGREVATLLDNEEFDEGAYEWEFDASALPSGVYFYRLESGSFERVMRMLLVR